MPAPDDLGLPAARGEIAKPKLESPHRDLIFRKGNEHEAAYLARLVAEGRSIVRIPTYDDEGFDADEARRLTEEAIRAGEADVIYQPYLVSEDERWRGFADFLERQPDGTYEPVDTKLARSAKPAHVLQLLLLRGAGRAVAGLRRWNGCTSRTGSGSARRSGSRSTPPTTVGCESGFSPRSRLEPETYPWPCGHCGICDFRHLCWQQRVDDDHLTLVAGLRRRHAEKLMAAGVSTLEALGAIPAGQLPPLRDGRRPRHLGRDVRGASGTRPSCSCAAGARARYLWELLPDQEERGFRLLPEPDEGDVWFDLEGHPFYEPARGLEFLFGYCYRDDDRRGRVRGALGA